MATNPPKTAVPKTGSTMYSFRISAQLARRLDHAAAKIGKARSALILQGITRETSRILGRAKK